MNTERRKEWLLKILVLVVCVYAFLNDVEVLAFCAVCCFWVMAESVLDAANALITAQREYIKHLER